MSRYKVLRFYVLPAPAGMSLADLRDAYHNLGPPRASGDEPRPA